MQDNHSGSRIENEIQPLSEQYQSQMDQLTEFLREVERLKMEEKHRHNLEKERLKELKIVEKNRHNVAMEGIEFRKMEKLAFSKNIECLSKGILNMKKAEQEEVFGPLKVLTSFLH